jgi:hypothetical protein
MMTKRDNYALGAAGLAVAGTPTNGQYKTSNLLSYTVDGVMKTKAATDNIAQTLAPFSVLASLAGCAIGASRSLCLFIYIRASDGALFMDPAVRAGALEAPVAATGTGYRAGAFETPPERPGYALIGAIRIVTNASGAYTPGTTSLAAANQTVTYFDFATDLGLPVTY